MKRLSLTVFAVFFAFLFAAMAMAPTALATPRHELERSYFFLRIYDASLEGRIEMNIEDLNQALGLEMASEADLIAYRDSIVAYVGPRVQMGLDGDVFPMTFTEIEERVIEEGTWVALYYTIDTVPADLEAIDFEYRVFFDLNTQQRGMLVQEHNWRAGTFQNHTVFSLIFSPDDPAQQLDLTDTSIWRGLGASIVLGIEHIAIGVDHILFLLALILPAVVRRREGEWVPVERFRPALIYVIKIITLFTLAHSITLALASLDIFTLPSRLVESIIAFSIAIAALDILVPIFHKRIGVVVFVFGLFHGFGFAGVLGEIGIPSDYVLPTLFGFNVGVEIGQVLIICLLFPVLYLLRQQSFYRPVFLRAGAVVLIGISMLWVFERALGFNIQLLKIAKRALGMLIG